MSPIVFPALCLHELQLRTGATDTIRRGLAQLSSDRRLVALLVAWFFALLVTGFVELQFPWRD